MARDLVRAGASAAALDTWSSLVLTGLGMLGLALLAVGPLVPAPQAFPYLPHYAFTAGGLLVVCAAMMRLRSLLIVLGCLALTAGLTCTLVGGGDPDLNLAALSLYCAAAIVLGAAGAHLWMAVPFLLVPLLIVAPQGPGWAASREAFSVAWERAVGGPYLLAGLPAGLAIAGATIRQLRVLRWVPVRPSAVPLLILTAGLALAGLVIGSLLAPGSFAQTVCMQVAVLSIGLGWIGLAYQIGRLAFVWEAAALCLLALAGALFLDRATQFPDAVGPTLGITIAASLVPASLASVGLLGRRWLGSERPTAPVPTPGLKRWDEAEQKSFYTAALTAPAAEGGRPASPAVGKASASEPSRSSSPSAPSPPGNESPPTPPPGP